MDELLIRQYSCSFFNLLHSLNFRTKQMCKIEVLEIFPKINTNFLKMHTVFVIVNGFFTMLIIANLKKEANS